MPHDYAAIQESREDALVEAFILAEFRLAKAQTTQSSDMVEADHGDAAVNE